MSTIIVGLRYRTDSIWNRNGNVQGCLSSDIATAPKNWCILYMYCKLHCTLINKKTYSKIVEISIVYTEDFKVFLNEWMNEWMGSDRRTNGNNKRLHLFINKKMSFVSVSALLSVHCWQFRFGSISKL